MYLKSKLCGYILPGENEKNVAQVYVPEDEVGLKTYLPEREVVEVCESEEKVVHVYVPEEKVTQVYVPEEKVVEVNVLDEKVVRVL